MVKKDKALTTGFTQYFKIYKINKEHALLESFKTNEAIIEKIVDQKGFESMNLKAALTKKLVDKGFEADLYFKTLPHLDATPTLKFVRELSQDAIEFMESRSQYILFFYKDTNLYAVAGGVGNLIVQQFAENEFGLDILSKILKEDELVIKFLEENPLFGNIAFAHRGYRNMRSVKDENDFGKVYRKILSELKLNKLTDKLKISSEKTRRPKYTCLSSDCFEIRIKLAFEELIELIHQLDIISRQPDAEFTLGGVVKVKDKTMKEKLYSLWENYTYDQFTGKAHFEISFCHPDEYSFLNLPNRFIRNTEGKKIDLDGFPDLDFIFKKIKDLEPKMTDPDDWKHLLKSISVVADEGEEGAEEGELPSVLKSCIFSEHFYKDKQYFFLNGEWYELKEKYLKNLNKKVLETITNNFDEKLLQNVLWERRKTKDGKWKLASEDDYIKALVDSPKEEVVQFHKVIPGKYNMELCDIFTEDKDEINLIHIKRGFGGDMRTLALQIAHSADLYKKDKNFLDTFLQHEKIKEQKEISPDVFKKKTVNFCLAFVDNKVNEKDIIKEFDAFKSCIAKMSVLNLTKDLKDLDLGFKIIQIKRTDIN